MIRLFLSKPIEKKTYIYTSNFETVLCVKIC